MRRAGQGTRHGPGRGPGYGAGLLFLGAGIFLLVLLGLSAQGASFGSLPLDDAYRYVAAALLAGVLYLGAVVLVRSRGDWPPFVLPAVLVLGVAMRIPVLLAPPVLSTDLYRYVWDGRVQAAGINPYRFIPADPALLPLRDADTGATAIFPNINRADSAPTIYPPAAQLLFAVIGIAAPSIWTVKAAMLGFDLLAGLSALLLLRAARRPAPWVLIWFWNPLVVWEFAGAGHIDAAAIALSGLAMLAAGRGRRAGAGLLLGLAVLFKLLPAALFPALWRRWDLRLPIAAAVTILLGYGLYASAGLRVFGYLPGYAAEEGMGGGGFLVPRLAQLLVPMTPLLSRAYLVAGALVLAVAAAGIALRRGYPVAREARVIVICRGGLILSGALMGVLSPHYPWYLCMIVLPATVTPYWAALWTTVAAPLLYLDHGHEQVLFPALVFLPALPLLLIDLRGARTEGSR